MTDTPDIPTVDDGVAFDRDPWLRFDTWAGEAKRLAEEAIANEDQRDGDNESASSATLVRWWIAEIYSELAVAAVAGLDRPAPVETKPARRRRFINR